MTGEAFVPGNPTQRTPEQIEETNRLIDEFRDLKERANPATHSMLKHFRYDHLPHKLSEVSKPFYEMASWLLRLGAPDQRELQVALRKLLEAKDAAVRSMISEDD